MGTEQSPQCHPPRKETHNLMWKDSSALWWTGFPISPEAAHLSTLSKHGALGRGLPQA